jgi:hypothetical protein
MNIGEMFYENYLKAETEAVMNRLLDFDELVRQTVPIYTIKNPDPKTGKEDCRLTKAMKEQRRFSMKNRLIEANGDHDKIKAIIERYARTEQ